MWVKLYLLFENEKSGTKSSNFEKQEQNELMCCDYDFDNFESTFNQQLIEVNVPIHEIYKGLKSGSYVLQ